MLWETKNQNTSYSEENFHESIPREFSDTQQHTCTVSPLSDGRHRWQMLETPS